MDRDLLFPLTTGVLFLALIGLCVWLAVADANEWEAFREAHHCHVVSKIRGDVFNTFSVDSKGAPVIGVGSTPDKTGWLCDDGVTYYR